MAVSSAHVLLRIGTAGVSYFTGCFKDKTQIFGGFLYACLITVNVLSLQVRIYVFQSALLDQSVDSSSYYLLRMHA